MHKKVGSKLRHQKAQQKEMISRPLSSNGKRQGVLYLLGGMCPDILLAYYSTYDGRPVSLCSDKESDSACAANHAVIVANPLCLQYPKTLR